ncbi:hypothetical protein PL373_06030 [Tenacibaculum maritimum]|nr:hypothetical protein [Tenacibaculum maritimum]MDB0600709.1 hypothetical protein [Tenacibaculum maritimum]MDB0612692.1 hypothetical protein [Tenacibaculum maritimum]
MQAKITKDGLLEITSETHLEAYALRKWSKDNLEDSSSLLNTDLIRVKFGKLTS